MIVEMRTGAGKEQVDHVVGDPGVDRAHLSLASTEEHEGEDEGQGALYGSIRHIPGL